MISPGIERDSLHYVRTIVDKVPAMLAYWDAGEICRYASRSYETWFGVDPDRLIGRQLRDLLGDELYELNQPHIRAALQGEEQSFERVIPGKDGVVRHSLAHYTPDVVDGSVVGFVAMVTEVTRLKQTEGNLRSVVKSLENEVRRRHTVEESLRATEESLSITLATIKAGFIATDREGRITRMNAISEQLTGWPQKLALGRPLMEVFHRDDRSPLLSVMNPVDLMIERGGSAEDALDFTLVARDGTRRLVQANAALTHDAGGHVRGLAMVIRDVTAQRAAEIDSNRLAAIVASSSDAIVGKRLDGRITSWNAAAESLFGYTAEEAIGRQVQMLIPADRQNEEMRILANLARGVRVAPFDTIRVAKDGSLREVSITISPIRDASGRIAGASKIVREVGDRNAAERARRAADRLAAENRQIREATRLKSQFLANMSHELRTPLNAIIGFAELLQIDSVAADPAKQRLFLGHIANSGQHLLHLINDLLDLSKVEAGKFEFFPERIHLPTLVKEVENVLNIEIAGKRLDFVAEIDDTVVDLVVDPARLKQVLYNLLSNAIKFTPEDGSIKVRAVPEGESYFRLAVRDTGVGIAAVNLAFLFQEFHQVDAGHHAQHRGTGLGLSLTRKLVEAQGGSVGVTSELGKGSEFHVILPRVLLTDKPNSQSDARAVLASSAYNLLVVEKDAALLTELAKLLVNAGFDVKSASNTEQAFRLAGAMNFDAMTLGLRLRDKGGLELLDSIRTNIPSNAAPVVGVAATGEPGTAAAFAIADILSKPIRNEEVVAAMARIVRPSKATLRVLVIDDERSALDLMRATLERVGIEVVCFEDARRALNVLDLHRPDAIVLDLMMPDFDGFSVLDALHDMPRWRDIPVFIWTSMVLTDEEYARLASSARVILKKGGGALTSMVERLRDRYLLQGD